MKAYVLKAGAGFKDLERRSWDDAPLVADEVRIRVRAAALNYRDLQVADGRYGRFPRPALVPLSDGAGEVVEVGPAAARHKVGDRVVVSFWPQWADGGIAPEKIATSFGFERDGTLAERLVAPEGAFAPAPRTLSPAEAATLSCAGVTAWNALFVEGALSPGATVLVMGTGGVAVWALQLAEAAGLSPVVISSSDEKLERARDLGAEATVNYRRDPDWQHAVKAWSGGGGVDLVVDVGGEDTLVRSLAATRVGGRVVVVGGLTGFGGASVSPGMLIGGGKRLSGIMVGSRTMLEDLARFVDAAGIRPVIDRTFGFDDAVEAFARLDASRQFGKLVVDVDGSASW